MELQEDGWWKSVSFVRSRGCCAVASSRCFGVGFRPFSSFAMRFLLLSLLVVVVVVVVVAGGSGRGRGGSDDDCSGRGGGFVIFRTTSSR